MLPPSIVVPSQRNSYTADFGRNLRLNLNERRVGDFGKNTFVNYDTERESTQQLQGQQRLNAGNSRLGVRLAQSDPVLTTNKDTLLYNHQGQLAIQNPKLGEYASGITDYDAKTTNKEMYIDNKYIAPAFKNKAAGYLNRNYKAHTTLKEQTTEKLAKNTRFGGRTRIQANSGKENLHIKTNFNKLLSENTDVRSKFHTNNPQVIPMKINMGSVADRNNDLSRIRNTRIEDSGLLVNQLAQNPFHLQGGMQVNPFLQPF